MSPCKLCYSRLLKKVLCHSVSASVSGSFARHWLAFLLYYRLRISLCVILIYVPLLGWNPLCMVLVLNCSSPEFDGAVEA